MRPGVVWFGEQLDTRKIERVEDYLAREVCDVVIVAGTTAAFGYIVDWALRARGQAGQLIEVNPDPTPLSAFATHLIREPAGIALPRLVDELLATTVETRAAISGHPERKPPVRLGPRDPVEVTFEFRNGIPRLSLGMTIRRLLPAVFD